MSIYLITVLANCIHICIKLKNNILKTQLFDYANTNPFPSAISINLSRNNDNLDDYLK